jgi:hypothetical protein
MTCRTVAVLFLSASSVPALGIAAAGAQAKEVEIVRPENGERVPSGSVMHVEVKVSDPKVHDVLIVTPFETKEVSGPPFKADIAVPAEAIGIEHIMVIAKLQDAALIAKLQDGATMAADDITVNVVPGSAANRVTLVGLRAVPTEFYFGTPPGIPRRPWDQASQQLTIVGSYSDGIERDLTLRDTGTTYISMDANVATVDDDGVIRPHGSGSTVVVAKNGNQLVNVRITVEGEQRVP